MKNKLERFVNEHRDAFDTELPGRDIWSSIDTTQKPKSTMALFFTPMRIAASLLVLVNAAVLVFLLSRNPETPISAPTPVVRQQAEEQPVSQQTLDQISKIVETKQAALKEVQSSNPVLYRKFTEAFSQLSSMYKELQVEFDKTSNKEALLEAMIQNLSLQQELLNQQLAIYQKVKQQKNEKTDKHI